MAVVTPADLWEMYYGPTSGHFPKVVQHLEAQAKARQADAAYLGRLQDGADSALREMEVITGVPRGSLGGKW